MVVIGRIGIEGLLPFRAASMSDPVWGRGGSSRRWVPNRDDRGRRRPSLRVGSSVESLERRALLSAASEAFVGPSLAGLITQAEHGRSITPAIDRMLVALQSQMLAGPLAGLDAGSASRDDFIVEAQSLEASFESNVNQQLSASFPNAGTLLKLQGRRVVADLIATNQRAEVGLVPVAGLPSSFGATIRSLTAGPIRPQGTTPATLAASTRAFKAEVQALKADLANSTLTTSRLIRPSAPRPRPNGPRSRPTSSSRDSGSPGRPTPRSRRWRARPSRSPGPSPRPRPPRRSWRRP